jgi:hypothetical protein
MGGAKGGLKWTIFPGAGKYTSQAKECGAPKMKLTKKFKATQKLSLDLNILFFNILKV